MVKCGKLWNISDQIDKKMKNLTYGSYEIDI